MKKKIIYFLCFILCICLSILGSVILTDYKISRLDLKCSSDEEIKNVSIVEEGTIKESISKVYDAVWYVETYFGAQKIGSGSGFTYKVDEEYGYILTNHHVVDGANKISVTNNNGEVVEAEIMGSDEYADIAVLRIPVESVGLVASLGESKSMSVGDTVFAVGSPLGSRYIGTVTKGILSGKDRQISVKLTRGYYRMDVIQTDTAVNPGNSGGPLVNINGEVIGVISMKLVEDQIEGMGFAIPIEEVNAVIDSLEKGETIVRPVLGVGYADVDSSYALYLYRIYLDNSIKYGSVITDVEYGYPASIAGLRKGDVIIELNGEKVEDSSHLKYMLYKYNVGDTVKLKYIRGKDEFEVEVKLDKSS